MTALPCLRERKEASSWSGWFWVNGSMCCLGMVLVMVVVVEVVSVVVVRMFVVVATSKKNSYTKSGFG